MRHKPGSTPKSQLQKDVARLGLKRSLENAHHRSQKENVDPRTSVASLPNSSQATSELGTTHTLLLQKTERNKDLHRQLHNTNWQLRWACASLTKARTSNGANVRRSLESNLANTEERGIVRERKIHTQHMRNTRASTKQEKAVLKVKICRLKEHGIIDDLSREMVRDLVAHCNISPHKINDTIHTMAQKFGVEVEDCIDERSVRRIMDEALVAAEIQLALEVHEAQSKYTLNWDFFISHGVG